MNTRAKFITETKDEQEETNNSTLFGANEFTPEPEKHLSEHYKLDMGKGAEKLGFLGTQVQQKEVQPAVEPVTVRQQRRYRTGRNKQLNIKATDETVDRFYKLSDEGNITLGEVLERALTALENANKKTEN
jgi:hypothetical protein